MLKIKATKHRVLAEFLNKIRFFESILFCDLRLEEFVVSEICEGGIWKKTLRIIGLDKPFWFFGQSRRTRISLKAQNV